MDRTLTLTSEGFEPFALKFVGIPFYVWVLNIDLEVNRFLHASEEALLGLLNLGITARVDLARLLGLEGEALFSDLIIDLVRSGGVEMHQDSFALTQAGRLMLTNAARKDIRRSEGIRIRYDPYWDSLDTLTDEDEGIRDPRAEGLEELALDVNLTPSQLTSRFEELARALRQSELNTQSSADRLRILRLDPVYTYTVYQRAELEVWHRASDPAWAWRLTDVGNETKLSEKLLEFEREQVDGSLIPRDRSAPPPTLPFSAFILRTFEYLEGAEWIPDYTLEEKMVALVEGAKERLLLVFSLGLTRQGVTQTLINLLVERLGRDNNLDVTVALPNSMRSSAAANRESQNLDEKVKTLPDKVRVVELALGDESLLLNETEVLAAAHDRRPLRRDSQYVVSRFGARYVRDQALAQDVWDRIPVLLGSAR